MKTLYFLFLFSYVLSAATNGLPLEIPSTLNASEACPAHALRAVFNETPRTFHDILLKSVHPLLSDTVSPRYTAKLPTAIRQFPASLQIAAIEVLLRLYPVFGAFLSTATEEDANQLTHLNSRHPDKAMKALSHILSWCATGPTGSVVLPAVCLDFTGFLCTYIGGLDTASLIPTHSSDAHLRTPTGYTLNRSTEVNLSAGAISITSKNPYPISSVFNRPEIKALMHGISIGDMFDMSRSAPSITTHDTIQAWVRKKSTLIPVRMTLGSWSPDSLNPPAVRKLLKKLIFSNAAGHIITPQDAWRQITLFRCIDKVFEGFAAHGNTPYILQTFAPDRLSFSIDSGQFFIAVQGTKIKLSIVDNSWFDITENFKKEKILRLPQEQVKPYENPIETLIQDQGPLAQAYAFSVCDVTEVDKSLPTDYTLQSIDELDDHEEPVLSAGTTESLARVSAAKESEAYKHFSRHIATINRQPQRFFTSKFIDVKLPKNGIESYSAGWIKVAKDIKSALPKLTPLEALAVMSGCPQNPLSKYVTVDSHIWLRYLSKWVLAEDTPCPTSDPDTICRETLKSLREGSRISRCSIASQAPGLDPVNESTLAAMVDSISDLLQKSYSKKSPFKIKKKKAVPVYVWVCPVEHYSNAILHAATEHNCYILAFFIQQHCDRTTFSQILLQALNQLESASCSR